MAQVCVPRRLAYAEYTCACVATHAAFVTRTRIDQPDADLHYVYCFFCLTPVLNMENSLPALFVARLTHSLSCDQDACIGITSNIAPTLKTAFNSM